MTGGLYKLLVSVWILLGLASCASVLTTIGDTYSAIVWRVHDKAVKLQQKADITDVPQPSSSRSTSWFKHRVAPTDSDMQSESENYSNSEPV